MEVLDDIPMPPLSATLFPLSGDILAYSVVVADYSRRVEFAVVFRGKEVTALTALGRLQWFVSSFVLSGELRDMATDDLIPAELPVDTLFLVSEIEEEGFWCGPSEVDAPLVSKAMALPEMLRWPWKADGQLLVGLVRMSVGET